MNNSDLNRLLEVLVALSSETEWVEFKANFHSEEEIGERLSALSNSACLLDKSFGYLVFGVEDGTHEIKGTSRVGRGTFTLPSHGTVLDSLPSHGSSC